MPNLIRTVVVFDAPDLELESTFWAGLLNAQVIPEEKWHSLIDSDGRWIMGFQLNLDHKKPQWPDGDQQQQIHLDLHTEDPVAMHALILELGGELLEDAANPNSDEGFRVYADPAGHPFCVGWGHPTQAQLQTFVNEYFSQ